MFNIRTCSANGYCHVCIFFRNPESMKEMLQRNIAKLENEVLNSTNSLIKAKKDVELRRRGLTSFREKARNDTESFHNALSDIETRKNATQASLIDMEQKMKAYNNAMKSIARKFITIHIN